MKTTLTILLFFIFSLSYCQTKWQNVSSKMYFQDSLRTKKDIRIDGPIRMNDVIKIGPITLTATGTELNILSGLSVTTSDLNSLSGINGNVQDLIDAKVSANNSILTGVTLVEQLQIGQSDSALIIGAMTDAGAGLTVLDANGNQVPYNNPEENTIPIQDIAVMQDDLLAGSDTVSTRAYARSVGVGGGSPAVLVSDSAAMLRNYLNIADSITGNRAYATDHRMDIVEGTLLNQIILDTVEYDSQDIGSFIDTVRNSQVGIFNVLDYGAVGDSATNSTAAFQACADAAKGGTMVIPAGVYTIDSLVLTYPTTIIGSGSGRITAATKNITKIYSTSGHPIIRVNFQSSSVNRRIGCKIENLFLVGNNHVDAGTCKQSGIAIDGESNLIIDRVHINNCGDYAIRLCEFYHTDKIVIQNSLFEYNKGGVYGRGIGTKQLNIITISQNEFYDSYEHGINVMGDAIVIEKNIIQGNDSAGIFLCGRDMAVSVSSRGTFIRNNYFEANYLGDIYAETYYNGSTVAKYHFNLSIDANYFGTFDPDAHKAGINAPIFLKETGGSSAHEGYVDLVIKNTNSFTLTGTSYNVNGNSVLDRRATIELNYLNAGALTSMYAGIEGANIIQNGKGTNTENIYTSPNGATGITAVQLFPVITIYNDAAYKIVTADPPIAAGYNGQEITIVGGEYATKFSDGDNLALDGDSTCTLSYLKVLKLIYKQSRWVEVSRSRNGL